MNRSMVFLINPECYHPLCNNCVDRLFENGPNQCPYIGCHKTLRKKAFREPTFADLNVEREVDIRRRVMAVFNRTEDEFEDLRAYNDYLNMVEDLVQDLTYGSEKERAEAQVRLLSWEDEHRAEIERNKRHGEKVREATRRQLQNEQEAARQRRQDAARLEEEEKKAKARQREEDLDMLTSAPAGAAGKVMLKKRGQHRKEVLAESEAAAMRRAATAASGGFAIRGLKKKMAGGAGGRDGGSGEDTGPYDPFGKLDLRPSRYVLKAEYKNDWLQNARHHSSNTAGGYSVQEYYSRSMFDAFAGLAVFVDDEKETGKIGLDFREVATFEAAMAAGNNDGSSDVPMTKMKRENSDNSAGMAKKSGVPGGDGDVEMKDVKDEPDVPVKMEVVDF